MVILPTEKKIDWHRPPLVVLALLVINLVVFLFSHSHDQRAFKAALDYYQASELPDWEWPAFQNFAMKAGDTTEAELQERWQNWPDEVLAEMAFDPEFDRYIDSTIQFYATNNRQELTWSEQRSALRKQVNSLSYRAFGLDTSHLSLVDLISHQFLHGGWMHLIGNMVFLFICGFAVEASLGSRRFLLFYLLGGIGGGLFFYLTNLFSDETSYLVGASGAISAVMAMYVTLFRLKKIEFFYWAFVVVGYFRAPALWLLPLYIVIELIQWLANDGANIAYTAHVGGFSTGFLLVWYLMRWQQESINTDYLEEDQSVDQEAQALDKVYRAIADYQFERALALLDAMLAQSSHDATRLWKIKLNLVNALGGESKAEFLEECIRQNRKFERLDESIEQWWRTLTEAQRMQIEKPILAQIGMRFLDIDHYKQSEAILNYLFDQGFREAIIAKLARRLAHYYERQGVINKKAEYTQLADSLIQASMDSGIKYQG
ncbi:rhomboid family intramembrane serine protease [Halioxenophilus sp. WMMB6]|uniref:rhomboid family intramembrane serine protease n=1 Tax=Halioxenophilus sp. WMMB6 TaxID=3073815 RepID=UPI00295F30E6|nr:rhomboid family intramembrane serine protease [Halioxenophilus sp. WMMB6]